MCAGDTNGCHQPLISYGNFSRLMEGYFLPFPESCEGVSIRINARVLFCFVLFFFAAVSKVNLPVGETKRKVPYVKVSFYQTYCNDYLVI